MTRKDRIKTYLTGVALGVVLLIVFSMMRGASGNGGGANQAPATTSQSQPEGDHTP